MLSVLMHPSIKSGEKMNSTSLATAWPPGTNKMAALIRQRDWAKTPLGRIELWDAPLRIAVSSVLDSSVPTIILWGPALIQIYNDAYTLFLGPRHPAAMGQGTEVCWPEVWAYNEPIFRRVMDSGEPTFLEDQKYVLESSGAPETHYFTIIFKPARDASGVILGVMVTVMETTQRVKIERENVALLAATRLAADQLKTMFDQAPGFIALLNGPSHIFELVNDAYRGLLSNRDVIGKSVRESIPETVSQGLLEMLDRAYQSGEAVVAETTPLIWRDGLQRDSQDAPFERYLDFVYQPIRDAQGRISGIFVSGNDVTDHRRAQVELREQRDHSRHIFDSMSEGFAIVGSDWRLLEINDAGLRIGQCSRAETIYRSLWEIWPQIAGTPLETYYRGVMATGVPQAFEQVIEFPDGSSVPLEIRVYSAFDGGLALFFNDISQRRENIEKLRVSQARSENAVAISKLGTFDWDSGTGAVECSPRARELFEFADGEGQRQEDYLDRILAADINRVKAEVELSLATDGRLKQEYRIMTPNGHLRHILCSSAARRNADGSWAKHEGIFIDMTERRVTEEMLRDGDRRKDEFLAMLAHELRNPIAPITTAAHILSRPDIAESTRMEMSKIVVRQAEHMTSLIEDLLDVSRINKGLVAVRREVVDLKSILAEAVEQTASLMEKQHHHFSMQLVDGVVLVEGDRVRLIQVFSNILGNAARYTPARGNIVLELVTSGEQAKVIVRDNGVGISQSLLPHIFDIFTQAERSADRLQGGLGLGLSLVKNLVGLHSGTVAVRSDGIGLGSEFTVSLPLLKAAAQPKVDSPSAPDAALPAKAFHIMVVDDNVDAAKTLATLLEMDGHIVTVASSGESALALASSNASSPNPPQVFVLDIGLPGIDGYELASRLRAAPATANAMLIALTGYGQLKDQNRSLAAGFNHHLQKPVDPFELLNLLGSISSLQHF